MEKDTTIYDFDGKEVPEEERDRVYAENPDCGMAVVYTELRNERVDVGGRMQWVDKYTTKMIPFRTFREAKRQYDFIVSQTHRVITDIHMDVADIIPRKRYKEIPYNKENIEKYKSKDNLLKHARANKNTEGIMFVDKNTNGLIGYIAWEDNYIIALEVLSDYRGNGFGDVLIEKAIKNGCNKLSVSKKNTVAIKLYKKYGFKHTKDINDKVIEMELKYDQGI